jgi:hypothetical protein
MWIKQEFGIMRKASTFWGIRFEKNTVSLLPGEETA